MTRARSPIHPTRRGRDLMCTFLANPKCFDQDRTAQAPLKHRQQSFLKSEQLQTNSNSTSKRPVVSTKSKPQTSQESSRAARVCQYTAQGYSGRLPGLCLPASGLLPGLHGRLHRRGRLERCGLRPPRRFPRFSPGRRAPWKCNKPSPTCISMYTCPHFRSMCTYMC